MRFSRLQIVQFVHRVQKREHLSRLIYQSNRIAHILAGNPLEYRPRQRRKSARSIGEEGSGGGTIAQH